MSDSDETPDGPRISEKKRAALAKAQAAARAKRKAEGMTPKQREAVQRMQEGRAAAAAQRKRVKSGEAAPTVTSGEGPEITPAPYGAPPASKGGGTDAPGPGKPAETAASPAPASAAPAPAATPAPDPTPTTTNEATKPWLKRALGL